MMKEWDFRIPFHSHEEEERDGGGGGGRQKSWSLGTYLAFETPTISLNC
jgi:hypothetical protein